MGSEVVVSYPTLMGEENLQCSPLLLSLNEVDTDALALWRGERWREHIYSQRSIETLPEDPAPIVDGGDIRGGSGIFKYQAICPFRAFAQIRLGARPLERAGIGLQASTRGTMVHEVLDAVWEQLNDHGQLTGMDEEALRQLVQGCVSKVLSRAARKYAYTFTKRFSVLEKDRLTGLVLKWLDIEKQRAPFTVEEREKEFNTSVGGVAVRLFIDRIDRLPDGRRILIDYKSGTVSPSQWFGERPEEPQLPLYATVVGEAADGEMETEKVGGVAFGILKPGAMKFHGVTEATEVLPSVQDYRKFTHTREKEKWGEVLEEWQQMLERIGAEFCSGHAEVDPVRYPHSCTYCGLQPLCRVYEQTLLDGVEEESNV
jgi:probable DNA repair protein